MRPPRDSILNAGPDHASRLEAVERDAKAAFRRKMATHLDPVLLASSGMASSLNVKSGKATHSLDLLGPVNATKHSKSRKYRPSDSDGVTGTSESDADEATKSMPRRLQRTPITEDMAVLLRSLLAHDPRDRPNISEVCPVLHDYLYEIKLARSQSAVAVGRSGGSTTTSLASVQSTAPRRLDASPDSTVTRDQQAQQEPSTNDLVETVASATPTAPEVQKEPATTDLVAEGKTSMSSTPDMRRKPTTVELVELEEVEVVDSKADDPQSNCASERASDDTAATPHTAKTSTPPNIARKVPVDFPALDSD